MNRTKLLMAALIAAAILMSNSLQAQDVKGTNFVNLGIGVGTFGFSGTGGVPIVVSAEHGFTDKISAGIYGGFIKRKFGTDLKYSYVMFGVKGAYHLNEVLNISNAKLDTYGGAALFYRSFKVKYNDDENPAYNMKSSGGSMGIGFFAGGRYFFSENIGAFAEVGYGISPLQLGLTCKF